MLLFHTFLHLPGVWGSGRSISSLQYTWDTQPALQRDTVVQNELHIQLWLCKIPSITQGLMLRLTGQAAAHKTIIPYVTNRSPGDPASAPAGKGMVTIGKHSALMECPE